MLRRYSSKNLDTIVLKSRRTTIGSDDSCDVVVKVITLITLSYHLFQGDGVTRVHATIVSTSSGFYLRDHSLTGNTKVNDKRVFGQVRNWREFKKLKFCFQQEIFSGDMLQVGSSAAPFVFDSEWMFGTRPNSAKNPGVTRSRTPTPSLSNQTILPVIEVLSLYLKIEV